MSSQKPLRLWPGVAIAIAQLAAMFGGPRVFPDAELPIGLLGAAVGVVGILVWWLLFSRAAWFERLGAVMVMIVAVLAMRQVAHVSIVGAGQGNLVYILPPLYMCPAIVAWAVATRNLGNRVRRIALVAVIDRKSTRLNSSHIQKSRMPSSA